jgi:hypothetical protein
MGLIKFLNKIDKYFWPFMIGMWTGEIIMMIIACHYVS